MVEDAVNGGMSGAEMRCVASSRAQPPVEVSYLEAAEEKNSRAAGWGWDWGWGWAVMVGGVVGEGIWGGDEGERCAEWVSMYWDGCLVYGPLSLVS